MNFIMKHCFGTEGQTASGDVEGCIASSFDRNPTIPDDLSQKNGLQLIDMLKKKSINIVEIKKMLENDISCINSTDKYGNSVMHLFIEKMDNSETDHIQFLQFLITNGADTSIASPGGWSPFLWAAKKNKFAAIQTLANVIGERVNDKTTSGDTALHLAIERGCEETVAILHQLAKTHGFNENVKSESSRMTPIKLANSINPRNEKILKILDTSLENYDAKNFGVGHMLHKSRYRMSSDPRGICVIFQNDTFDDSTLNRTGCCDAERLESTFRTLKFDVRKEMNLNALQMFMKIKEYSQMNHEQYDCFVLCISTHGEENCIFGKDRVPLPIKDIVSPFAGPKCRSLDGKPKLFFISACRNAPVMCRPEPSSEMNADNFAVTGSLLPDSLTQTPENKSSLEDIFEGYSTPYGFRSFREISPEDSGRCISLYVDVLCDNLDKFADTLEFQQIILKVNQGVWKKNAHVPSPVNMLLKELWFMPQ